MKTFIIAALTADGYVAKNPTHTSRDWTAYEDKRLFTWLTKWAKVIVVGHNTYKTFDRPFPGRRLIVYTSRPEDHTAAGDVEFTNVDPKTLLARLEQEKVAGVAICGGVQVYSMFLTSGLVREFYLSVQPVIFGQGMTLFNAPAEMQLDLAEAQISTADNMVILHYVRRTESA